MDTVDEMYRKSLLTSLANPANYDKEDYKLLLAKYLALEGAIHNTPSAMLEFVDQLFKF